MAPTSQEGAKTALVASVSLDKKIMTATSIIPSVGYNDALKAIEWLCDAFGFEKHLVHTTDEGLVSHAQLKLGNVMIMVGSQQYDSPYRRLTTHPGKKDSLVTQSPYIVIDDIDTHYEQAKQHGARIAIDLEEQDYGGKNYACYDLEGHLWNFGSYDPWKAEDSELDELKAAEDHGNVAVEQNNVEAMDAFMSGEWRLVGETSIITRQRFFDLVRSGDLAHTKMDFETVWAEIHGNTGLVVQRGTSAGIWKGKSFSSYEWASNVLIRQGGQWRSVLTVVTPNREGKA